MVVNKNNENNSSKTNKEKIFNGNHSKTDKNKSSNRKNSKQLIMILYPKIVIIK